MTITLRAWKIGDKIKYKSIRTKRFRTSKIISIIDEKSGKYELSNTAIVYKSDYPDVVNLSWICHNQMEPTDL